MPNLLSDMSQHWVCCSLGQSEKGFLKPIAWKVSVFGVFLVRIFSHLDWIWRDYLFVFSTNAGKYEPEKLRTRIFHAVNVASILIVFGEAFRVVNVWKIVIMVRCSRNLKSSISSLWMLSLIFISFLWLFR